MSAVHGSAPRLTGTSGRLRGRTFDVPPGRTSVGRILEADITLEDGTVSRDHATLMRTGGRVVVTDLGSTNGTWVNDEQVIGSRELRDGDVVHFGSVGLRFVGPPVQPGAPASLDVGTTADLVRGGDGTSHLAGRDQQLAYYNHFTAGGLSKRYRLQITDRYDLSDEVFQGRGVGRVLAMLGYGIALAGFGIWMYFIYSSIGRGIEEGNPLDREVLPGVPMAFAGFGMFVAGAVLAAVGTAISQAVRRGRRPR